MTKRQRAHVVELLRCGADLAINTRHWNPGGAASYALDAPAKIYDAASNATANVFAEWGDGGTWTTADVFGEACLEAAARVEEGSWP